MFKKCITFAFSILLLFISMNVCLADNQIPVLQTVVYRSPTLGTTGVSLSNSEIANKFDIVIYARSQMQKLPSLKASGFEGKALVYMIMDVIMGPSNLSSVSMQKTLCNSSQKNKAVNSNSATMDTGDFCEIHDAIIKGTSLPDYPDIYPTENWFLHRSNGTRLESSAGPDATYKVNPGDKNWQKYFARRALRELEQTDPNHPPINGTTGIFIDNVQLSWTLILKSTGDNPPKEYSSSSEYVQKVFDFLNTTRILIKSANGNFDIWGNVTPVTGDLNTLAPYLDGAMLETFALWWGKGPASDSNTIDAWDKTQKWIKSGKHFLAIAQGDSNMSYSKYALAVFLLVTDGVNASYKYRNYFGSYDQYFEIQEYYTKLGLPVEDMRKVSSNPNIYERNFACGKVQLNLTNHTSEILTFSGCNLPQPTSTPQPSPTPTSLPQKEGDVDGDGNVNLNDLNILIYNFRKSYPDADFNSNGIIDIYDYNKVIKNIY